LQRLRFHPNAAGRDLSAPQRRHTRNFLACDTEGCSCEAVGPIFTRNDAQGAAGETVCANWTGRRRRGNIRFCNAPFSRLPPCRLQDLSSRIRQLFLSSAFNPPTPLVPVINVDGKVHPSQRRVHACHWPGHVEGARRAHANYRRGRFLPPQHIVLLRP
jgi:hypothetical protein